MCGVLAIRDGQSTYLSKYPVYLNRETNLSARCSSTLKSSALRQFSACFLRACRKPCRRELNPFAIFLIKVRSGRYASMAEVAGVLSVYENVKSCIAIAQSIYSILAKAKDAPRERQQYLDVVDAVIRSLESLPRRLEDAQKGNS